MKNIIIGWLDRFILYTLIGAYDGSWAPVGDVWPPWTITLTPVKSFGSSAMPLNVTCWPELGLRWWPGWVVKMPCAGGGPLDRQW